MYTQLATRSVYTFLESTVTISDYVKAAKDMGYTHLGIMDTDNLYASQIFVKACHQMAIQPILGCEMTWQINGYEDPVTLMCVAKDTPGYYQLVALSSRKMLGETILDTRKEAIDHLAFILPYEDGIESLSLPFDSYIGIEPDSPLLTDESRAIAMHRVTHLHSQDTEVLRVLSGIKDNKPLYQVPPIFKDRRLQPVDTMSHAYHHRPHALSNLNNLCQTIAYTFDTSLKLPRFNPNKEAKEELADIVWRSASAKSLEEPVYQERLQEELTVIHEMGFDDYFLIVHDLMQYAAKKGYYMGMGRGSAAGSLVAYVLDITGIDPIKNHLIFERFLNRERFSMPDIDIDMPDIHRSDVLKYVNHRYGDTHTAQIVTFSTFGAKQALRDTLKRYEKPEHEIAEVTRAIGRDKTLEHVYETNLRFRQLIQSKPEYQEAFALAKRLQGWPRQTSTHAAGVVISDMPLMEILPIRSGEEMPLTQFDGLGVEACGLLKMDFLGLRHLTLAEKMQTEIRKSEDPSFSIREVDLEDTSTLELFSKGETKGIFQFDKPGAIRLLRQMKPTSFEDIVATTSLNRPGASDYTENYLNRRSGKESVDLIDDSIAAILRPTYGVMLYQEQVMQIAQSYAGFSLGKADILRRAMGKKDPKTMQAMSDEFLEGAVHLGHTPERAMAIFERMAKFAGYGFNRSHAYTYSALAFQEAYVKVHYPAIYYQVMMQYAGQEFVLEAIERGFSLAPLSINTTQYQDTIQKDRIYLGFHRIKGVGRDLSEWLSNNRPFNSVEDLILRLPNAYRTLDILTPLIQVGALDEFGHGRQELLGNLSGLLRFAETFSSIFGVDAYAWKAVADDKAVYYQMEKEVLGVGISPHPLKELQAHARMPILPLSRFVIGDKASCLVQIEEVRVIRTKKDGRQMAFLKVTDLLTKLDVTVFPNLFLKSAPLLKEGATVYITGRAKERHGAIQLMADELEPASLETFWVKVDDRRQEEAIGEILKAHPGDIPVIIHDVSTKETMVSDFRVSKSTKLESELAPLVRQILFRKK